MWLTIFLLVLIVLFFAFKNNARVNAILHEYLPILYEYLPLITPLYKDEPTALRKFPTQELKLFQRFVTDYIFTIEFNQLYNIAAFSNKILSDGRYIVVKTAKTTYTLPSEFYDANESNNTICRLFTMNYNIFKNNDVIKTINYMDKNGILYHQLINLNVKILVRGAKNNGKLYDVLEIYELLNPNKYNLAYENFADENLTQYFNPYFYTFDNTKILKSSIGRIKKHNTFI